LSKVPLSLQSSWWTCDNKRPIPNFVYPNSHFLSLAYNIATLAFGLRPRQGGWGVVGLEVDPGVTSHAPGSANTPESVREWTLTLPSELPRWELVRVESQKDSRNFKERFEGSKIHGLLRSLYQWKALEV
jgi:hypothetical protein